MKSDDIRAKFIAFFTDPRHKHELIQGAPLIPSETDKSVLFTTAGMQQLAPYLLGEEHPKGKRLVSVQKCVRTQDIDEIGDNIHVTFFEMLGNWSLGDYFKEDAIKWSYEFLIDELGLDKARIYITCFEGNDDAPKDKKSAEIWKSLGIPKERIYFLGEKDNWWSPGDNGPCGPDTEMFYDVVGNLNLKSKEEFKKADEKQQVVEIWNDVFMEYEKKDGRIVGKLKQQNVDTGAGLERLAMVMQGKDNIFDTDLFSGVIKKLEETSGKSYTDNQKSFRIIADHIRSAVFITAEGVLPSNTEHGYIVRRLIRRAVIAKDRLGLEDSGLHSLIEVIVSVYEKHYPYLRSKVVMISRTIEEEEKKFRKTLDRGIKQFERTYNMSVGRSTVDSELSSEVVFDLVTTYGFPFELVKELADERGLRIDEDAFNRRMELHRETSRAGAEQKFKGGLADASEETTMLHTATHLMLAGLRKYLGEHVHQAGSNITAERTRFDFTHGEKVDRGTLDKVEAYVNEVIRNKCNVVIEEMDKNTAMESGVEGSFWERYPDTVNVYMVKSSDGTVYSSELCGGPHVKNTGDIKGTFKITKEEASSAGVRRVKAVLK
ncbi:alanine--tRNA ligase [Patescibacteria group bacterium]|nr:alanine--tRNA ligase [Patescibacteria group bacterium]